LTFFGLTFDPKKEKEIGKKEKKKTIKKKGKR